MKGIIIHGNPMWGDNERATYCEFINNASHELTQYAPKTIVSCLKGEASKASKAVCSKDDTYDFETAALIALMKMCGLEKSAKAYAEIYDDTAYGDALKERDRLDRLLREAKEVINTKARFIKEKNEEIEKLKKEKEQIITAKSILNNKLIEENSNLSYIKSCNESTIESLENTRDLLINKNNELIEENEKLKLDCEKLQHGYNDMILCSGRQNGKQHTALVNMFKKLDQKKVDAAYKEAYNTTLPVWQKEALRQAYDIHKESKEKTELPRTLDINGTTYRKSIQIKDFGEQINKLTVGSLIEESRDFMTSRVPNGFRHVMTWWVAAYNEDEINAINYLPPMRWDLFKKGRIVVACTEEEVPEFREKVVRELGNIRMERYSTENIHCNGPIRVYFHYDKNINWLKPLLVSGIPRVKVNNHKVVYWEDVR